MKIAYTPMNVIQKWSLPIGLVHHAAEHLREPVDRSPANMPKIAATPMIRWKCATTKYVSCR